MKRKILIIILILAFVSAFSVNSYATLPTFDAVNAFLSEIRNALMQSQFAQDIALSMERLKQLRAHYEEVIRFNYGLDDIFDVILGDPLKDILNQGGHSARDAFIDLGWVTPDLEILNSSTNPHDIRRSLETLTGQIPDSTARPYIPFEELQVIEGFQLAAQIRESGEKTRDSAQLIRDQAKIVSPKGASRLTAEALSHMIVLSQQNQEAMAKLLELEATQVEQVSREEKVLESERLKYTEDAASFLRGLLRSGEES